MGEGVRRAQGRLRIQEGFLEEALTSAWAD